jgi:TPP-dependent pyruvate/acetoin dehydrogenase alpha subunit
MTVKRKKKTTATAPSIQNGFSLISNEKLLQLYATMLKCRMLEERIRSLRKKSKLQGNAVAMGQEAAAAGVILNLGPEDTIAPLPGDVIAGFIKGVPLNEIFAGLRAPVPMCHAPLHVLPACSSLPTQLALAAGVALAGKMEKNSRISVVFCGDMYPLPELCLEALRFAGVHRLPILHVCWNSRPEADIALQTQACGFPCIAVDGNDAVAVYRVASEAIAHARKGNGPTLIECKTGIDPGPVEEHPQSTGDPLLNMEKYLARKGLFSEESKRQIAAGFGRELDSAGKSARKIATSQKTLKRSTW